MNKLLILSVILLTAVSYSQNVTNTLGVGGTFTIKDSSTNYFTLTQSTGEVNILNSLRLENTTSSTTGVIYKGADRFIHNFGTANTFAGINSGNFTMTGGSNSAFGYQTLSLNTTGYENSAFGYSSLYNNTTGYQNSAFGSLALVNNTTGVQNSAFGFRSLFSNVSGSYNSAFGWQTLLLNNTGSYNSAFGWQALSSNTTGSNNTGIGYNAQVPSGTASNQVKLGDSHITYAGVQVAWTITSDRIWKDNIFPSPLGLSFISRLNPVSYTRKDDENGKTEFGLIAQEVEDVLKQEGIENSGMITITDEGDYELRYNDLLAPTIKAIQELNEKNQKLINKNQILEERLKKYEEMQDILMSEIEKMKSKTNEVKEVKLGEK